MSLRQSLADTVRDKGRASMGTSKPSVSIVPQTSGSPSVQTLTPKLSSGGTGMGKSKSSGMGAKNGIGFPKGPKPTIGAKSSMGGIKGATGLGKNIRGK